MNHNITKFFSRVALAAFFTVAFAGTAVAADKTITLDYNSFGLTTSYAEKTATVSGYGFTVNQGYKGSGNVIQMNSSKGSGILYNTTAIPGLKSITVNVSSGNKTYTITTGTSENPTANSQTGTTGGTYNAASGDTYFQLKVSGASYFSSIVITYDDSGSGSTPTETVATPTFDPAAGTYTSAQNVTISTTTSGATIYYTTDGSTPSTSSNVYSAAINVSTSTTIKAMAVKEGMNNSGVASAAYTINLPYSGDGYVRINSLDALADGDKVIIAARYNATSTAYYAMTASASGKPTGVAFTSTSSNKGESLPISILNNESTYCWTVGKTSNGYTFSNASNEALGYTSSTNFAIGGDNTEWVISRETSSDGTMVSGYEGFVFTNKNNSGRGIALNNSHNYGPYATSNMTGASAGEYNFYLDIFVEGATANPTISADDVVLTYDATSGSIAYSITYEPSPAGTLTASTESDWLSVGTVGATTIPLTCESNSLGATRTATVTLTYTYGNSKTVTKNVSVTQAANPNVVPTIAEVRTQGSGTATTKGIVTSISGSSNKTAYIQDASAAIVVYGDFTAAVGDEIRVSGTLSTYKGLLEITSPSVTVLSSNNSVTPEVMTIAQVNSSTNQGWLVKIEDATVTAISEQSVTIAQNANTIVVRFNSSEDIDFAVNDVITFVGNIGCFNTVQIANPTDVVVQVNTAPVINASDVEIEYNATSGEIAYTIDNPASGVNLGATSSADWISNINVASDKVTFTTTANNGDTDRTATFTLTYTGATDKTVTVTQKHFVADYATLPFSFDGGKNSIENTVGLSQKDLGTDYSNSPKLRFDGAGDWLILKFNERPGTLSFDVKGNPGGNPAAWVGTFKVQTSEDGSNYTDLAVYDDLSSTVQSEEFSNLGENVRFIKWIYSEKTQGNVALGNISLTNYVAPSMHTVSWTAGDHTELFVFADDQQSATIDSGDEVASGTTVWISVDVDADYVFNSLSVKDANNNDVALTEETPGVYFSFTMPSSNVTITSSAIAAPPVTGNQYALYTGELVEGDYIIYYDGSAMKSTVSNNRLYYETVSPDNDVITTSDASIVWHIAQSGSYWTIYSEDATSFAASTGAANKAQLLADGTDDKALWTVSGTSTYEFVNKANAAGNVNSYLRNNKNTNSNYGFACYAEIIGGDLSLYKLVETAPDNIPLTATLNNGRYWTTFYNSSARYTLSEGAQAFIMGSDKVLYRLGGDGSEIPANTAVVIIANSASITLTKSSSTDTVDTHSVVNILEGSDIAVAKRSGGKTYVLGVVDGVIGFYEYTASENIPAAKAFYFVNN